MKLVKLAVVMALLTMLAILLAVLYGVFFAPPGVEREQAMACHKKERVVLKDGTVAIFIMPHPCEEI